MNVIKCSYLELLLLSLILSCSEIARAECISPEFQDEVKTAIRQENDDLVKRADKVFISGLNSRMYSWVPARPLEWKDEWEKIYQCVYEYATDEDRSELEEIYRLRKQRETEEKKMREEKQRVPIGVLVGERAQPVQLTVEEMLRRELQVRLQHVSHLLDTEGYLRIPRMKRSVNHLVEKVQARESLLKKRSLPPEVNVGMSLSGVPEAKAIELADRSLLRSWSEKLAKIDHLFNQMEFYHMNHFRSEHRPHADEEDSLDFKAYEARRKYLEELRAKNVLEIRWLVSKMKERTLGELKGYLSQRKSDGTAKTDAEIKSDLRNTLDRIYDLLGIPKKSRTGLENVSEEREIDLASLPKMPELCDPFAEIDPNANPESLHPRFLRSYEKYQEELKFLDNPGIFGCLNRGLLYSFLKKNQQKSGSSKLKLGDLKSIVLGLLDTEVSRQPLQSGAILAQEKEVDKAIDGYIAETDKASRPTLFEVSPPDWDQIAKIGEFKKKSKYDRIPKFEFQTHRDRMWDFERFFGKSYRNLTVTKDFGKEKKSLYVDVEGRVHILSQDSPTSPMKHEGKFEYFNGKPRPQWRWTLDDEKYYLAEEMQNIKGAQITAVNFSDDGKNALVGYSDGTVRVSDIATGEITHDFRAYQVEGVRLLEYERPEYGPITQLVMLEDEDGKKKIVTASGTRVVVWPVEAIDKEKERAKSWGKYAESFVRTPSVGPENVGAGKLTFLPKEEDLRELGKHKTKDNKAFYSDLLRLHEQAVKEVEELNLKMTRGECDEVLARGRSGRFLLRQVSSKASSSGLFRQNSTTSVGDGERSDKAKVRSGGGEPSLSQIGKDLRHQVNHVERRSVGGHLRQPIGLKKGGNSRKREDDSGENGIENDD